MPRQLKGADPFNTFVVTALRALEKKKKKLANHTVTCWLVIMRKYGRSRL